MGESAPLKWMPLPDEGEIPQRNPYSRAEVPVKIYEAVTRQNVPRLLHPNWTKAERDRANEVALEVEPHAMCTLIYSDKSGKQYNATTIGLVFSRGDQEEFYRRIVCRGR